MSSVTQPKVVGSEEQKAIWQAFKKPDHLVIEALAGTGKTFSITEGYRKMSPVFRPGTRAVFVAFNKSIQKELEQRAPQGLLCKTMHSLCFGILRDTVPILNRRNSVDQNKTYDILDDLVEEHGHSRTMFKAGDRPAIHKLVSILKNSGFVPGDSTTLSPEITELFDDLCDTYDIQFSGPRAFYYELAFEIIHWSIELDEEHGYPYIDFDDMIWLPYVLNLKPKAAFDIGFIDEAQDLNVVQHEMVLRLFKRIVMVGDSHQAIYGFRGADHNSMNNLADRLGDPIRLPLTVCRRCPVKVIQLAQALVPEIQHLPDAEEGAVFDISKEETFRILAPGDMVLCRVNAEIVSMAYRLFRERRRAFIQGRDIGKGLGRLIKDSKATTITDFLSWLDDYEDRETERLMKRKRSSTSLLAALNDKCACLRVLCDEIGSIHELEDTLDQLFDDRINPETAVRLSSVHRAKGLEANRVFILAPELMPHPMATKGWEKSQEVNIAYVAVTRARRELFFVGGLPTLLGHQHELVTPYIEGPKDAPETQSVIPSGEEASDPF